MKGLVVHLNGDRICTAAVADGVLAAAISIVGPVSLAPKVTVDFHVGGIDGATDEQLDWPVPPLSVGDVVTIRVVETEWVEPEPQRKTR